MNTACKIKKSNACVAGLFYYFGLLFLLILLGTAIYWQLEKDPAKFEFNTFNVVSTEENRSFYVPLNFCSQKIHKFTVSRYYRDKATNIFYNVPDGEYHSNQNECFNTMLVGHTGRLSAGEYEYTIYVKYDINPLRSMQVKVALVNVTVE